MKISLDFVLKCIPESQEYNLTFLSELVFTDTYFKR